MCFETCSNIQSTSEFLKCKNKFDTIVIGGGMVGASVFFRETLNGNKVLLIESEQIGGGATYGNAAMLAVSEIRPFATWNRILSAPNMLFRSDRALKIDPLYLPKLLPWLWELKKNANRSNFTQGSELLSKLCAKASMETLTLFQKAKALDLLISREAVRVYQSKSHLRKDQSEWKKREKLGVEFSFVDTARLKELLPSLNIDEHIGIMVKNYHSLVNPQKAAAALVSAASQCGAHIINDKVAQLLISEEKAAILTESGQVIAADNIVVAAGIYSRKLAEGVGDKVPLESERGYHVQFKNPGIVLDRAYTFLKQEIAVSPIDDDVRVCGFTEFAGLEKPPVKTRFKEIVKKAKRLFPDLNIESSVYWMGYRPSTPDSLPVIGPSQSARNLYYCFGHGHLGITLAAISARILSQIIKADCLDNEWELLFPKRFSQ